MYVMTFDIALCRIHLDSLPNEATPSSSPHNETTPFQRTQATPTPEKHSHEVNGEQTHKYIPVDYCNYVEPG